MAKARNFLALNDPDPKEMSVVDHLDELRHRLIVCIITVAVGSVAGWFVKIPVYRGLVAPLLPYMHKSGAEHVTIVLPSITAGFTLYLKLSIAVGIILGLPVLLYQIWMFIAPAVSLQARRYAVPFVLVGILLFLVGGTVGYFIFPRVVSFLVSISTGLEGAQFFLPLDAYVAQFALVMVIFGAVFEMPVVLTFLAMIGITSSRWLRSKRKYAGMLGLIGAMIITPGADPFTPFITAGVVYLLYEASIISVRLLHR
jgi:sec-independent protein translocase protein TatC